MRGGMAVTLNERNQLIFLGMVAGIVAASLTLLIVLWVPDGGTVVVNQVPTTNYFDSLDEYWDEYREWQECNMEHASLICGRAPIKPTTINMP